MADLFKNGAQVFAAFGNAKDQAAHLNYNQISRGNYQFYKKTYNPFNNSQNFGANGFNFVNEFMIIPMKGGYAAGDSMDVKRGDYVPAMSMLYLKDRETSITQFDGLRQGQDGQDIFEVRYQAHRGAEFFGLNRFAYGLQQ
jgi:hypothetical protein